jgi:hypothetical protein
MVIWREFYSRISYFSLILLTLLFSFSPPTFAQSANEQGLNIEISPLPIELTVKPGSTTTTDLRVRNSGTQPEQLKASLKTFEAEGADGHIVLHDPTPADDFTKWVSFDKTVFTAPPGQWQTIKMTVSPPKSAAFGYYYAVQFELANPPKPQPGTARLQGAVAIFVLLNVDSPGASRRIEVTHFSADHTTYEFLPASFNIQVRNTGNVHTAPHGNIFIKRGNHQVAALSVNSTEGMVLPKSNRIFYANWSDGFPVYTEVKDDNGQPIKDANGNIKHQLKWDFSKVSKLRFGHYTANLVLVYNDGQRDVPISGTLSFWVIPWRLVAIIFGILALIAGLVTYVVILRRRLKNAGKRSHRG